MSQFILAVDFDGTIVDHKFPEIGVAAPGAFKWLKHFQSLGIKLILWTMRSDGRDNGSTPLTDAVNFCEDNGIQFWSINSNPQQSSWTKSPKVYAHCYIDDAAIGCPLLPPIRDGGRKIVDWETVGPEIIRLYHNSNGI